MATIKRFTDIVAWQKARELVKAIYGVTRTGAFSKDWGLKDQIQRAAVSICSNIAEGFERSGNKEFVNFLWIAKGSAGEVSSQLYNAKDCGYVDEATFTDLQEQIKLISAMLYNLIHSVKVSSVKGERYK
jgi:four helix bundle protein